MPTILITGSSGFIGTACVKAFLDDKWSVYGIDIKPPTVEDKNFYWMQGDIREFKGFIEYIFGEPDVIVHLAGQSSVVESWKRFEETMSVNIYGTKRVLDFASNLKNSCKVLLASSSAVYGSQTDNPIKEDHPTNPVSPYGVSKLAMEKIAKLYTNKNNHLNIIVMRLFNQTGPGKTGDFCSDLMAQINNSKEVIEVGNLDKYRDITDIRDTVAYIMHISKDRTKFKYYTIINICGGRKYHMYDVILKAMDLNPRCKYFKVNRSDLLRNVDEKTIVGDTTELRESVLLSCYTIDDILQSMLAIK